MYVGIDPGKDGAVCFLPSRRGKPDLHITPTIASGKGGKRLYNVAAMAGLIQDFTSQEELFVALEKGTAMRKQGVTSMFNFGKGCGLWEGILAALKISYVIITPQQWQKIICTGVTGDAKARAILVATRAFPNIDFRKSARAWNPHTGKTDATCLALYAKYVFS